MKARLFITGICMLCTVGLSGQGYYGNKRVVQGGDAVSNIKRDAAKTVSEKIPKNDAGVKDPNGKTSQKMNRYNKLDVQGPVSKTVLTSANKEDFAYYRHVVRKNGWYVGIGKKATKEQASHMNCYYKLSKKNAAGNWTLMQAYAGGGFLTTNHDINTYLIRTYDERDAIANEEWKEKLNEVCQWVFIDSYDGKTCIQEKGLNSRGDVIYSMIITKIGPFNYFCTYIDVWGRPATMRRDSTGSDIGQANFVEVTRDKNGYDILTKYYDRNGFPAKNRNGSYMLSFERDINGNIVKAWALNVLGQPMVDDWNYCGDENVYDANGNKLILVNIGLDRKPAKGMSGTYGSWFAYDQYGNITELGDLDEKRQKCSDKDGVFRHVFGYGKHGDAISYERYDKDGKIIPDGANLSTVDDPKIGNVSDSIHSDYNGIEEDSIVVCEDTVEVDSIAIAEDIEEGERYTEKNVIDSISHTFIVYKYDNGVFYKGYALEFDNNWERSKTMYNITSYGALARTGNALYYKVLFGNNIMGGETMMGVNEFGEPAYITEEDSKAVAFLYTEDINNESIDYDEFGIRRSPEDLDSLSLILPRVFCIEVTDTSQAYPMGIRNNDIILSYGDWRICKDVHSAIEGLYDEIDRTKELSKTMTVLRHHPETQSSEVVILELKNGTPQELGFLPRIIYYTQQEKKRLITTAEAAAFEFSNKAETNNVEVPF